MPTEPDWTAAIADAQRWIADDDEYPEIHLNLARCLLAAHEERERHKYTLAWHHNAIAAARAEERAATLIEAALMVDEVTVRMQQEGDIAVSWHDLDTVSQRMLDLAKAPRPAPTETAAAEPAPACSACRGSGLNGAEMRCGACHGAGRIAAAEPSSEPAPKLNRFETQDERDESLLRIRMRDASDIRLAHFDTLNPTQRAWLLHEYGVRDCTPEEMRRPEYAPEPAPEVVERRKAASRVDRFVDLLTPGGPLANADASIIKNVGRCVAQDIRTGDYDRADELPPTPASPEPAKVRARTLTYGDGTTWPWWVHVEPLHDTHRTPDADQRYQLTLSDGAMDVAHGDGWEGQPGDADGFTHADCLAAAWRLNAAIVSAPPEPEPVEWVDGRADVGDARLLAAWSPANGRTLVIDITHRGTLQTVRHRDEATAKRLAIALAQEMARC